MFDIDLGGAKWRLSWMACAAACVLAHSAPQSRAEESPWDKQTIVYKTAGPTHIAADVYRRNGNERRPALVWIHGGALIMGSREGVPRNLVELCRERNYVLISLDYRLAPEVKLPAIIEDIQDAFRWIAAGAGGSHVDPTKIAVAGGSAGGYLTMMSGICVEPKPRALVAHYGYGDVDGPWYTQPSAHYRKQPLVSKEEAESVVGGDVKTNGNSDQRGRYYLYLRQNGLWTKEVSSFDPKSEPRKLDPYCPVRNITPSYPPILMVHGTVDTDVPYQESADMAEALKKQGVKYELITIENGEHGLGGGDPKAVADAQKRGLEFIRQHLE